MNIPISAPELAARLQAANPPRLLDVRQPEEHELAALPGATLIPLGELAQRAKELVEWQNQEIVVYCHHGMRSLHAIQCLRQLGFTQLRNLSGGLDQWAREVDLAMPRY